MVPFQAVISILLLITNINGHVHNKEHISSKKTHSCVHDTLDHQIQKQRVKYDNHPYESMKNQIFDNINDRRKLISDELEQSVEPIRISPYYNPDTITTTDGILTTNQITHIKQLVSAAIRYFESFVSVVPVHGSLFLHPCNFQWNYGGLDDESQADYRNYVCSQLEIPENPKCGDVNIPDDHLSEGWYYDSVTGQSTKFKDAGNGIADADLAIYITYNDSSSCGDGTLAYAGACAQDQFGRPIAGYINFCSLALQESYWKFDVATTVHELTHVLVMSSGLWSSFYNSDTMTFRGEENVITARTNNWWVTTEKVKEIAIAHFDCDALIGAPLENSGGSGTAGSHWESKYINYEYMGGTIFSAWMYMSKFTFSLMEDSGWYVVDFNYAERYPWAQGEGCDFINNECIDSTTSISNFPQYWCDTADDHGCTFDYVSIGDCYLPIDGSSIPSKFKYYTDNSAGPESHDFCGFVNPITVSDFENICWDIRGNSLTFDGVSVGLSTYGVDSRCVDTVASGSNTKRGYCFQHDCTGFDEGTSTYSGVDINVNTNEIISCSRTDGDALAVKSVTSISEIESITCPNIDTVCGTSTLPFECYFGKYNDLLQKCICAAGYKGTQCDVEDSDLVAEASAGTGPTGGNVPKTHTSICVSGIIADDAMFLNGRYDKTDENEGYPAYYNESINFGTYVYYQRYGSNWLFGSSKGASGNFGYCEQYSDDDTYPEITECSPWYVYNQVDYVIQKGLKVGYDMEVCDDANHLYRNIWVEISVCVLLLSFVI